MHTKIYFTKSSSTKHFTGAVKLRLCLWSLVSFFECLLNRIRYLYHFSYSRTDWQTLFVWFLVLIIENVYSDFFGWKFTNSKCFLSYVYWSFICDLKLVWLTKSFEILLRLRTSYFKIILIKSVIVNLYLILLFVFTRNVCSLHHNFSLFCCYLLLLYR